MQTDFCLSYKNAFVPSCEGYIVREKRNKCFLIGSIKTKLLLTSAEV